MRFSNSSICKMACLVSVFGLISTSNSEEEVNLRPKLYQKVYEWTTYKPRRLQQIPHTMQRAGHSDQISPRAALPKPGSVKGYPVGGGMAFGQGHGPTLDEGTWGWDSTGTSWLPRSTWLGFGHGRKSQGSTGSYATDKGTGEKAISGHHHPRKRSR